MSQLAQIDLPIDELKDFGQASINVEGMLVMTLFIFALTGLIYMLVKLRTGSKDKSGELTTVLQTLGGVIANELKGVVEDSRQDRAAFMEAFAGLSRGQAALTETQKEIALVLTGHDSKVDDNQTAIIQLSTDQQITNQQVTDMNGDIVEIKQLLKTLLQAQDTMNKTVLQAQDTMSKNLLLILEKLEDETEAETEKLIEIPKVLEPIPKTPGVPVTPKPEDKQIKEV